MILFNMLTPQNKNLIQSVLNTIKKFRMIDSGDKLLIAVSGGPDSMALLHVLIELSQVLSFDLTIAHLDHGLRGSDSEKDAKFVKKRALSLNIPFYIEKKDVKSYKKKHRLSLEEAARRVRYDFLDDISAKTRCSKIALGHNADDNAELVLMNMLRGSGPLGLSGIPPVRDKKYIRPLIEITRSEITEFLTNKNIKYVIDKSNKDIKFTRNRIRHNLIPLLKADYNPEIIRALNRFSSVLREDEKWMKSLIEAMYGDLVIKKEPGHILIDIKKILRHEKSAIQRIIRKGIKDVKGNLKGITYDHIIKIADFIKIPNKRGYLHLPDRIQIKIWDGILSISKKTNSLRETGKDHEILKYKYIIDSPRAIIISEIGRVLKLSLLTKKSASDFYHCGQDIAFFDMDKISFPIVIRNFRSGDRFRPLGMKGTKKLKKFFADKKVPKKERRLCPILLCEDKIIWIGGHQIADTVKVTESTEKILTCHLMVA